MTKMYDSINNSKLSQLNWRYENFEVSAIPAQTDSYNCGPLCLMHIDYLANASESNELERCANPNNYRHYIELLLLKNSDNMTDTCLICGEENYFDDISLNYTKMNNIVINAKDGFITELRMYTSKLYNKTLFSIL